MPLQLSAINGALTDVTTSATNDLGAIHIEKATDGTVKKYKYVKFANSTATVAAGAGSLVGYRAAAASGYSGSIVCADMTDADAVPLAAGATLATITGTAGTTYYCWIQIQGLCTLDTAVSSGAAGTEFLLSTTDKTGTVRLDASVARAAGVSVNTTTLVVLDCLE